MSLEVNREKLVQEIIENARSKKIETKVEVTVKFTEWEIACILSNSFNAIAYWAEGMYVNKYGCINEQEIRDSFNKTKGSNWLGVCKDGTTDEFFARVLTTGGSLEIVTDDEDGNEKHIFDLEQLTKGIRMAMENNPCLVQYNELGEMDAEETDCVIQYAIFNEVVFG